MSSKPQVSMGVSCRCYSSYTKSSDRYKGWMQVLQRGTVKETKSCYLRYLKLTCDQTQHEMLLLWSHKPPNSRKYSPVVFPEDLRDVDERAANSGVYKPIKGL
ncbi:hypothetical protein EYF80_027448 [Liparis tanakae]|uniref:Uncharacterized protein n=1 Tax=Liparis tanakae TaxID=230148 RepID=A0A4Z2H9Q1_9TELE|nr:hypothetical protein EYF80_027448 [Liparis tanakae]